MTTKRATKTASKTPKKLRISAAKKNSITGRTAPKKSETEVMTFRVKKELAEELRYLAENTGLPLSRLVNIAVKTLINNDDLRNFAELKLVDGL